ncbi:MAG: polysaccharide biosynthesis tyrosine autokinase [Pirellulales bacterium]|nr:polysaccharide biosynthesis tyrosine autokinase [Pirellulales bacterium]
MSRNEQSPTAPSAVGAFSELHALQNLMHLLRLIEQHKGFVTAAVVVSCLLGGLYYATATRLYQSNASVLVIQTGADSLSMATGGAGVIKDMIPTYRSLLRSDAVLEDAVKRLAPEQLASLAALPPEKRAGALRQALEVSSATGTNLMDIAYRSTDPDAAAAVVECVLQAYVSFMELLHRSTGRDMLEVLTQQKDKLEGELQTKESELLALRSKAGVIREDGKGTNAEVKRAMALNEALIQARKERLNAETVLTAVEGAVQRGENLHRQAVELLDDVGSDMLRRELGVSEADSQRAQQLHQQLLEDKAELQSLSEMCGPAHHRVRQIQMRIQGAEEYLGSLSSNASSPGRQIANEDLAPLLLTIARQRCQQAVEQEASVLRSYEEEKGRAIALEQNVAAVEIAEHDVQRLRNFYDVVVERIKNVDLSQDSELVRTSIVSHPTAVREPVSPRLRSVALISLFLGLVAGVGTVYVRDLLDDRFRSLEDMESQLRVPVMAVVGKLEKLVGYGVEALHTCVFSNSAQTEAFRTLRTAVTLSEGGVRSLVVSSVEPADGKTTVVANLAVAFAQSGKRTLLIDSDLRRPGLTPLVGLRGHDGLTTALLNSAPMAEVVEAHLCRDLVDNLDVLPSGPRPANPAEMLMSNRFPELLGWAESNYDVILIDGPPVLPVADSLIIGRLVDGVLFVVRPEKTRRRPALRAVGSIENFGVKVLGIVANHVTFEKKQSYYGYGYGYGYSYHYGYGHEEEAPAEEEAMEAGAGVAPVRIRRVA